MKATEKQAVDWLERSLAKSRADFLGRNGVTCSGCGRDILATETRTRCFECGGDFCACGPTCDHEQRSLYRGFTLIEDPAELIPLARKYLAEACYGHFHVNDSIWFSGFTVFIDYLENRMTPSDEFAADLGELEQRGAAVVRIAVTGDEAVADQPVRGAGDARRVHLQARDHARQRQGARAAEGEQAQHLVARERQRERAQRGVHPREQQLLGPHDRGHQRHAVGGVVPAVHEPLPLRLGERVDGQGVRAGHSPTLPGREPDPDPRRIAVRACS